MTDRPRCTGCGRTLYVEDCPLLSEDKWYCSMECVREDAQAHGSVDLQPCELGGNPLRYVQRALDGCIGIYERDDGSKTRAEKIVLSPTQTRRLRDLLLLWYPPEGLQHRIVWDHRPDGSVEMLLETGDKRVSLGVRRPGEDEG